MFGHVPDAFVWLGAAIIAGSGLFMLYSERRKVQAKAAPRLAGE